ncbi:MAG TPA: transposase [Desulfobacterales bacterium]|nr:transposase [Desulfobacterales bacterium]
MARKPRINIPGGIYHVMLRGNGGHDIFWQPQDQCRFLLLVQEGIARFDYRVHAFCLMTNHVHLIIQIGRYPLSKIVHNLSFRYTMFINKQKKQTGHLFQGRYKAFLIDADSYLLELVRYIHNNPVRANIVGAADAFPWSSHRAYSGYDELPWLTTMWVLGQFTETADSARQQYRNFIAKGAEEGYRADFHKGMTDSRVIGDDSFLKTVISEREKAPVISLQAIIETVCRSYGIQLQDLQGQSRARMMSEARGIICWLAQRLASASISEVAILFKRDISTMSRAVGNIDRKSRESEKFSKIIGNFLQLLHKTASM